MVLAPLWKQTPSSPGELLVEDRMYDAHKHLGNYPNVSPTRRLHRVTLLPSLLASLMFLAPSIFDGQKARADECPHLLLYAGCTVTKDDCCTGYIVELSGNLGADVSKRGFHWSLSRGRIVEGEKTTTIRIYAEPNKTSPIEIKVRVTGLDSWPSACKKELSLTLDTCKDKSKSSST
jgi:hypothetical protein